MQIIIKTQSRNQFPLEVQTTDNVESVKLKIQSTENVAPVDQRLLFQGKQLDNDRSLGSYEITENSVLYLIKK